jgi:hypothetical protein
MLKHSHHLKSASLPASGRLKCKVSSVNSNLTVDELLAAGVDSAKQQRDSINQKLSKAQAVNRLVFGSLKDIKQLEHNSSRFAFKFAFPCMYLSFSMCCTA